ncbi:pseudouridine synthase pus4 [Coniothyrium glycines]
MACTETEDLVLEGVFSVVKPARISSAEVLQNLQEAFAPSLLFAPLLQHQPKRPSKSVDQVFKLGHGGTLDPLAAGILVIGIGRGTKHLQQYLACTKTYETTVLFGASTDTYDSTGVITERAEHKHITKELVEKGLVRFRGTIQQIPPVFSALKINGIKACNYARQGTEVPRQLQSREMHVAECSLIEWFDAGRHRFSQPGESTPAVTPAARIRLTVCSGFYVRSFVHDLGLACRSRAHMAALLRTQQASFSLSDPLEPGMSPAITFAELEAGEQTWAPILRPQLEAWITKHPVKHGHINGRDQRIRWELAMSKNERPRQRFQGGWVAETKSERIQQQGGRYKGKWNRKSDLDSSEK